MTQRQVNASSLPTVTPPWLQQSGNATQNPGQQTQQQPTQSGQQSLTPKQSPVDYLSTANKLYGAYNKITGNAPFWAQGSTVLSAGSGAATGALSAAGGTYVTGSGLAGTAGAIHTTAGAAGSSTAGGAAGGLASAGVGLAAGFLGGKMFGSEESAMGAGTGASIGMSVAGPIGAAIGFVFGGIAGKLFEGNNDYPFVEFSQGASLSKGDRLNLHHQRVRNTKLGSFAMGSDEINRGTIDKILGAVEKSDGSVAGLLSEDQLARAKQGLNWFETDKHFAKVKGERIQNMMGRFFKERYGMAMGGLDLDYRGTFNRVANDKNMAGLISTMSHMDRDIKEGKGIFADFQRNDFDPSGIDPNDTRLQSRIRQKNPKAGQWTYNNTPLIRSGLSFNMRRRVKEPDFIMVDNPKYDAGLVNKINQYKVTSGYNFTGREQGNGNAPAGWESRAGWRDTFDKKTAFGSRIGNEALQHIAQKYGLEARPAKPAPLQFSAKEKNQYRFAGGANIGAAMDIKAGRKTQRQQKMDQKLAERNQRQNQAYNQRLGAWEKQVLDTYANRQGQVQGSASNLANVAIERSNQPQGAVAQGSSARSRNRLFGNVQQQSVKLNRAEPKNNNATNAGLLQRGGYI